MVSCLVSSEGSCKQLSIPQKKFMIITVHLLVKEGMYLVYRVPIMREGTNRESATSTDRLQTCR